MGKSKVLLYIVEAAVPLLTWLMVWALALGLKQNFARHKKIAFSHAIATWASYAIVILLVRLGFTMGGNAPDWIVDTHLVIIYLIPPLLVALMVTGLKKKRAPHGKIVIIYVVTWSAALVTGAMIFLMDRGYL